MGKGQCSRRHGGATIAGMALDTLTLEQLLETRQSLKNQLSRVSGIQAEAVKDKLADVEDRIRIRQDERRLPRIQ